MKIIESPTAAWRDEVLERSAAAYFTHTPAFQSFCSLVMPKRRDCSLGFQFDDGTRAFIPIQQISVLQGLWRSYESGHKGYGGLVADGPLDEGRQREALDGAFRWCFARRFYTLSLYTSPLAETKANAIPTDFPRHITATLAGGITSVVRLQPNYAEIVKHYNKGRKSDIGRARREGVQVERVRSESRFFSFHDIYRDRVARWGERAKTNFDRDFYQALHRLAEQDPRVTLWMASHQGKDYAGAVIFYQGASAFYWIGASLEDDQFRPNSLLLATIIEDACQRGVKFFDMGRSGRPSLFDFKKAFGAEPMTFQMLTLVNRRAAALLGVAEKIRKVLPS